MILSACSETPPRIITQTKTVEVPVVKRVLPPADLLIPCEAVSAATPETNRELLSAYLESLEFLSVCAGKISALGEWAR